MTLSQEERDRNRRILDRFFDVEGRDEPTWSIEYEGTDPYVRPNQRPVYVKVLLDELPEPPTPWEVELLRQMLASYVSELLRKPVLMKAWREGRSIAPWLQQTVGRHLTDEERRDW